MVVELQWPACGIGTPDGISLSTDKVCWYISVLVTWSTPHGCYQAIDTAQLLPLRSFYHDFAFFIRHNVSTTKLVRRSYINTLHQFDARLAQGTRVDIVPTTSTNTSTTVHAEPPAE